MGTLKPARFRFRQAGEGQWKTLLRSSLATEELGIAISQELQGGEIITLTGELGAGKTCCVRGVAKGLGLSADEVSSPTFMIIQQYESQPPMIHADLYRLENSTELDEVGLSSYFDTSHVVIIEWADRVSPSQLPEDRLALHLTHGTRHSRHALLQASGPRSRALLENLLSKTKEDSGK